MTKYVVSGYIGFDNFGDEAICGVLTKYLKSKGHEVTVLSANPEKTACLYGVKSVNMLDFIKPILVSDVLISGGGSLLQDITSLKSLIYYIAVIMTAIAFGKKVYIFAQGFTPFRTKIGEFLTKFVLKYCEKITVRDVKSQEYLRSLGIEAKLVTDPVFGIDRIERGHNDIGVQLRGFKTLTDEFLNGLADGIAKKFQKERIKLYSLQDNIDLPIINKFAEYLTARGILVEIYKNMSVTEVIEELSKLEYLIGMRFHSNLVAAKSGVKVLGINYDIKVKALAEEMGFPIINMLGCEVESGLDKLLKVRPEEYKIPEFSMSEIID